MGMDKDIVINKKPFMFIVFKKKKIFGLFE
jgi:hypothetical protein